MRRASRATAWLLSVSLLTSPSVSRAGTWTGGSTEWTQIANNIQLTMQLIQQVLMVANLVKQLAIQVRMAKKSPKDAFAVMHGFHVVLGSLFRAAFVGKALADRWKKNHPGKQMPAVAGHKSVSAAYDAMDRDLHAQVGESLRALDVHVDPTNRAKEDQIMEQLKSKALSAEGEMQAQEATNQLLLEIIRQLRLLRDVAVVQARMESVALGEEAQRRLYRSNQVESDYEFRGLYRGSTHDSTGAHLVPMDKL